MILTSCGKPNVFSIILESLSSHCLGVYPHSPELPCGKKQKLSVENKDQPVHAQIHRFMRTKLPSIATMNARKTAFVEKVNSDFTRINEVIK